MEYFVNKTKIRLVRGDITILDVDTIVNAANRSILGGGGVDGAIHRRAGPELRKECGLIRKTKLPDGLPTGEAVITKGYNLKARHVIHTVGPVYNREGGNEAVLLSNCYKNSINLAIENNLKTIAFPAISTGAYGYPIWDATEIALASTLQLLEKNPKLPLDEIVFVCFSLKDLDIYKKIAKEMFKKSED